MNGSRDNSGMKSPLASITSQPASPVLTDGREFVWCGADARAVPIAVARRRTKFHLIRSLRLPVCRVGKANHEPFAGISQCFFRRFEVKGVQGFSSGDGIVI